jgi:hypothetical protein
VEGSCESCNEISDCIKEFVDQMLDNQNPDSCNKFCGAVARDLPYRHVRRKLLPFLQSLPTLEPTVFLLPLILKKK